MAKLAAYTGFDQRVLDFSFLRENLLDVTTRMLQNLESPSFDDVDYGPQTVFVEYYYGDQSDNLLILGGASTSLVDGHVAGEVTLMVLQGDIYTGPFNIGISAEEFLLDGDKIAAAIQSVSVKDDKAILRQILSGHDTINLSSVADWIGAGTGRDEVRGRGGNDTISGGGGNDTLYGNGGRDHLFGNKGQDTLLGGYGHDILKGGRGDDRLEGHRGSDTLRGEGDRDVLLGGAGSDALFGGGGNDTLRGGDGADVLNGGMGRDILTGGKGADVFVFAGRSGADVVRDFRGSGDGDRIDLSNASDITSFADLSANHVGKKNGNLLIKVSQGNSIELDGVSSISELEAADFIF